ncbi:hypothetical protein NTGBS_250004 [Candidatus Nitrotoga sp. BS]|nr:hypothetical protein NTGBS_250004 [Candidatus Nitrotoga sp. BS]
MAQQGKHAVVTDPVCAHLLMHGLIDGIQNAALRKSGAVQVQK